MQRICAIIREEMDAIGANELSMPTLHPADVWQATGRYDAIGQEMYRLKDRGGRDMVLAMTHEEVFAWLASRELRSYRDLPKIWYQFQLKFRDEPRPKGGVLRVREFLMKDSYSFDMDEAGLEVSYAKHIGAYDRIFSRCGVEFLRVESDSGFMGGAQAHEYMAPSAAGEDRVAVCGACGYAANVELARSVASQPAPAPAGRRPAGGARLDATRAHAKWPRPSNAPLRRCRRSWASSRAADQVACVHVRRQAGGGTGSRRPRPAREQARPLPEGRGPAGPRRRGARGDRASKWGSSVRWAGRAGPQDHSRRDPAPRRPGGPREYAAGANKPHTHLQGVVPGRDFQAEYADLREAKAGDACPECGGGWRSSRSSRWGTSSSWAPSTRSRWVRPCSTRAAGETHRHGLVWHRAGQDRRRRRGAEQRRTRHRVAQDHRALRCPPRPGAAQGCGSDGGLRERCTRGWRTRGGTCCGTIATSARE